MIGTFTICKVVENHSNLGNSQIQAENNRYVIIAMAWAWEIESVERLN